MGLLDDCGQAGVELNIILAFGACPHQDTLHLPFSGHVDPLNCEALSLRVLAHVEFLPLLQLDGLERNLHVEP
eukprot:1639893-Heterocapsa_arctica.AAC.1